MLCRVDLIKDTEHTLFSSGGRFKKEIVVDGQSYLLLIRDEGGPPELQVSPPPHISQLLAPFVLNCQEESRHYFNESVD